MPSEIHHADNQDRRDFVKKVAAVIIGALSTVVPAAAGLMVLCDPLRIRQTDAGQWVRVTSLDTLPDDGVPRKYTVVAASADAWNRFLSEPIGAVYLRRTGPATLRAFNVVCPHAGCFVNYVPGMQGFRCPCHGSAFALNGAISDPTSPSPRGLDSLEVEVRSGTEVWVRFHNYLAGHKEKIPIA